MFQLVVFDSQEHVFIGIFRVDFRPLQRSFCEEKCRSLSQLTRIVDTLARYCPICLKMTIYVTSNSLLPSTSRSKKSWGNFHQALSNFSVAFIRFSVHRLVMMSASKYFAALLGPNFKEGQEEEVSIADIDGATLKLIIDFCYTGELRITDENIMQIIAAASAMEFVLIEEKCQQFWNNILEKTNCVEMFSLADRYSFALLRKRALDMICGYFEGVPIGDLQALTFSSFSELIKCDQIHAVWQEEFIFQRMALWVDHNEVDRAIYAPELFQSIRLEILAKNVRLASASQTNM